MRNDEEQLLRSVALQNANSILLARQRAEAELLQAKDALERKTGELAHSLAMMRATLESTTDAILVTDDSGRVTGFNQKLAEMWQIPPEVLQRREHRQLLDLTGPRIRDPQQFRKRIEEIYATSPPETYDLLELVDGRIIERHSALQCADERNVGRVWSFRDITKRKRAEEALRDETRVLNLLNQTGAAIASTLDLQTLLQTVTDAATESSNAKFGAFFYTATNEEGGSFLLYTLSGAPREAFAKFGHPRATPVFAPTFQGEAPVRSDDILQDPRYGKMSPHYGMPDGHLPVRSYLAVPVISRSGEVLGGLFLGHPEPGIFTERTERIIVGLASHAAVAVDNARLYEAAQREISERKRAEEALRYARDEALEASQAKNAFLANMSHELRTPLNAIIGYGELVRDEALEKHETGMADDLDKVILSGRHLLAVIGDILDLSKMEAGKIELLFEEMEALDVAREAADLAAPLVDASGNSLLVIVESAGCTKVRADRIRLRQVLFNLISNAAKFTERGSIRVVCRCRAAEHDAGADWVELAVEDTGVGMSEEQMARLFRAFEQLDPSPRRRFGGTGLGLVISRRLLELMGGTLAVESEPEKGSSFIARLPMV